MVSAGGASVAEGGGSAGGGVDCVSSAVGAPGVGGDAGIVGVADGDVGSGELDAGLLGVWPSALGVGVACEAPVGADVGTPPALGSWAGGAPCTLVSVVSVVSLPQLDNAASRSNAPAVPATPRRGVHGSCFVMRHPVR